MSWWNDEEYLRRVRANEDRGVAIYSEVTDPVVIAVLDVLAPHTRYDDEGDRSPIFEFGHESTPTRIDMVEIAEQVAAAVRSVR